MSTEKLTAERISILLDQKFHNPASAMVAFEVNEGTGATMGRRADAISFTLIPSLGYKITGYEFKTSRADWLNELRNPDKSQSISRYCDHWYLIAPKGVLGIDELPKMWGFIQASEKSLTTKIRAPQRETEPLSVQFMASLIRSSLSKYSDKKRDDALRSEYRKQAEDLVKSNYISEISHLKFELSRKTELIDKFQKETGLYLNDYNFDNCVDIVKRLQDKTTLETLKNDLVQKITFHKKMMESISETISDPIFKNIN